MKSFTVLKEGGKNGPCIPGSVSPWHSPMNRPKWTGPGVHSHSRVWPAVPPRDLKLDLTRGLRLFCAPGAMQWCQNSLTNSSSGFLEIEENSYSYFSLLWESHFSWQIKGFAPESIQYFCQKKTLADKVVMKGKGQERPTLTCAGFLCACKTRRNGRCTSSRFISVFLFTKRMGGNLDWYVPCHRNPLCWWWRNHTGGKNWLDVASINMIVLWWTLLEVCWVLSVPTIFTNLYLVLVTWFLLLGIYLVLVTHVDLAECPKARKCVC